MVVLDESVNMIFLQEMEITHFLMTPQILTGLMTKGNWLFKIFWSIFYHDVYTWALIHLFLMENNLEAYEVKFFAL